MRHTLLFLALLTACGTDADGDGFPLEEDCDDSSADINPDATEICDGVDNNCDGATDEGVLNTYYNDQDRDGYGDADQPVEACQPGIGQVEDATDCNDNEDTANPAEDEICFDGIDNNCDGATDEDAAVDATTWYPDADGDGFGVEEGSRQACAPGDGWAADGGDCDDAIAEINPGADEVCGDGIDNDCKDGPDDGGAIDALKWHRDMDNDTFGDPDVSQRACLQPDGWVSDDTDCDDDDIRENPNSTWYPDGDGDGFGATGVPGNACERVNETDGRDTGDCNDEDVEISPDAEEIWYDGVDQDCNGLSDYDQDEDGYDSADEKEGGEDCDDLNGGISPREAEIADGIDNNCDSLCDEGYINAGDLIITEVMRHPLNVTDAEGEFFEIYNDTSDDIVICGGWEISDNGADSHEITGGPYTVTAGDFFVFGIDSDTTKNGGVTVDYEYSDFLLSNSDDEIILDFDGTTIDEIEYADSDGWPDRQGQSMNLDPDFRDATDNDDADAWCPTLRKAMSGGDLGTPGAANEECPEEK